VAERITSTAAAAEADPHPVSPDLEPGPRLLRPFGIRDFRLLFSGETVSVLGDQFHFVALAWLALQLTGSGLALGTVLMTAAVPRAVFMLLGGAFSDRFSPRTLMLLSNAIRGVVVAVVAALVLTGTAQLWHLYVLAAIFGIVDAFFYPALNTIVPMLIPERQLAPANALVQGSQQVMGLIGPAVAGVMVAAVQTGPAFAIDAASFGIAAAALLLIRGGRRRPAATADRPRPALLGSIGDGVRAAWADPGVRSVVVLTAAFNGEFTGPVSVGLAWLADNRFVGGSAAFGFLFAAWGAGAVLGAITGGSIHRLPRMGTVVLVLAILLGIGLGLIGIAPSVPVALAIIGPMGAIGGFLNVQIIAWLQARVPEERLGRVMSLVMLGSVGLAPVSLALAGALIDLGAVTATFLGAGAIVVAASLAGFVWGVPRHMDTPTP
jgi:MFS family permease